MFVGRDYELGILNQFKKRNTAGLIVCRGRRRIGKSTLIQEYGKKFKNFYEFYGLPPRENISNNNQLQHFGELMGACFKIPALRFDNWTDALVTLSELTSNKGRVLILLDEISWIGSGDKDFAGKLKGVWDTKFKKNKKLILVLCGSVTSWIDKNILNDKGFMGRVSLTLTLEELPLSHANQFWKKYKHISCYEKFKMLSITGGVPRYLEEIIASETAEENIKRMCFSFEGLLYSEFDKIFNDIFNKRSDTFRKIVKILVNGSVEPKDIALKLGKKPTGNLSELLSILVESGFVSRDFVWNLTGNQSRKSKYRLKDNYLRFYLKYIEPEKDKIQKGLFRNVFLENLKSWDTIMGLQIQNLVLNNLPSVLNELNIAPESVISASPYFQKKTLRSESTQIDLLIDTRYAVYICEIKYRKKIDYNVINEMEKKIDRLKNPKKKSVRTVLIYLGELTEGVRKSSAFTHYLPLERFLQ